MANLKALAIMACLALIWLLRPFVNIRFGNLFVSRLGHLTGNTECYLCEIDAGMAPKRCIDILVPQGEPANAYLLKMFSRVMWVSAFAQTLNEVGKRFKWWQNFNDTQFGRDIHNLMEKQPPHLKFTRAEERRGQRGLRELGIPEGAKWVCIIVRDPVYLKALQPEQDYSYHSFRDSDVDNYRAAAVALMERGYYVLRMGVSVSAPMRLSAPQFIDYAISGKRSEFMDIYLGAKCEFCISNSCGFDGIPMIFRRPICFVNEAPLEYLSTWMKDSLAIWKHHVKDGKRMTPAEIFASGAGLYARGEQYAAAGITLVENTPEEIRDAALEMIEPGQWWMPQPAAAQMAFWDAFPRSPSQHNGVPLHGEIRLRIGEKFLAQYQD